MAKFHGKIGFSITEETTPGVWAEKIHEKTYYGDVLENNRRWDNSGDVNGNITISNRISVICDDFARQNLPAAKYVVWNGNKISVSSIGYQHPRIVLSLGGVYNG